MVAPAAARARLAPTSSSSAVAVTNWSAIPGPRIRNTAVSLKLPTSSPSTRVRLRQVSQLAGVKATEEPPLTRRFVLPETRATVSTRLLAGARHRRRKKRPVPFSRTLTLVALITSKPTWTVWVAAGAADQFASPAWAATTVTVPIPLKDRLFSPVITPGPEDTAKVTGRPLEAAADKATTFVAS